MYKFHVSHAFFSGLLPVVKQSVRDLVLPM